MTRQRLVLMTLMVLLGSIGSAAQAEALDDRAEALAAVREGNERLDAGDAAGALERFQRALALVRSPKLHFNFGQALAGIPGREAEAHEEFARYLEEVPDADNNKRAEAGRQLLALGSKIALLSIATDPEGVEVAVDGQPRGVTPLPRPLAFMPTPHEIHLAKRGFAPISEVIDLAAGQRLSKEYLFQTVAAAAPPPKGAATLVPLASVAGQRQAALEDSRGQRHTSGGAGRRTTRVAGLVTAGGGVLLEVAGILAYRTGVSKVDHIMQAAVRGDPYSDSDGDYKTWGYTGIALMIAGGASLATGAVLYWLNRDGRPGTDRPIVSIGYLPGIGANLQIAGDFR